MDHLEEETCEPEKMEGCVLQLELKQLPSHLRYAFLGDKHTFPVIISNVLKKDEED